MSYHLKCLYKNFQELVFLIDRNRGSGQVVIIRTMVLETYIIGYYTSFIAFVTLTRRFSIYEVEK